jgi:hypothetical protein
LKDTFAFTLYEVFGYLMPGSITGAALSLIFWSTFEHDSVLPLMLWRISPAGWALGIFLSYLFGHSIQALANRALKSGDDSVMSDMSNPVVKRARERAATLYEADCEKIESAWLQRLMDEFCIQYGHPGDRDMFTYREGFYKGTAASTALFGLALLARIVVGSAQVRIADSVLLVSRWELMAFLLVSAAVAWASYLRFRRFTVYRVARVIAAFVVLSAVGPSRGEKEEANA